MFLYYITDRRQLSENHQDSLARLLDRIGAAAAAGVDAIQLREKDLSPRELVELGLRAVGIVQQSRGSDTGKRTRLLINSRVDAAIACGAHGVHLRSDDISAADARSVFMQAGIRDPLIGVSCHVIEEVELAEGHGADFAVFGPVFGKSRTTPEHIGIFRLETICRERRSGKPAMPVLALGGIDTENAVACLKAGASGVAGIRLFQSGDVAGTVEHLRSLAR